MVFVGRSRDELKLHHLPARINGCQVNGCYQSGGDLPGKISLFENKCILSVCEYHGFVGTYPPSCQPGEIINCSLSPEQAELNVQVLQS